MKINYDSARRYARLLYDTTASVCQSSGRKAGQVAEEVPAVWKAADGEAFMEALTGWKRDTDRLRQELERLGRNIKTLADELEAEEKEEEARMEALSGSASALLNRWNKK